MTPSSSTSEAKSMLLHLRRPVRAARFFSCRCRLTIDWAPASAEAGALMRAGGMSSRSQGCETIPLCALGRSLNMQRPAFQGDSLGEHAYPPRLHALGAPDDDDRKRSRQRFACSIVDGERREFRVDIETRVVDVPIDGDQETTVLAGIRDVIYVDSSIIRDVEAYLRPGTGLGSERDGFRTCNTRDQQSQHTHERFH